MGRKWWQWVLRPGALHCCWRHYHFTRSLVTSPAHTTISLTFMNPEIVTVTKWLSNTSKYHHPPTLRLLFTKQNWSKQKSGLIFLKWVTNSRHVHFCKVRLETNPLFTSQKRKGTRQLQSWGQDARIFDNRLFFQTCFRARSDAVLWKTCRNFLVLSKNSWV